MATSGTYAFMLSRDDLIGAALRCTTRFGAADAIPAQDITYCAQALNILCKSLAIEGMPLWCVQQLNVPFVVGQSQYNLSALSNSTLPLRVVDVFWRSSTGNDVQLNMLSRSDYDTLGQKQSPGNPNQYWYDPQLTGGILTVYNVPQDATSTLQVVIQRQIQDINLAAENPDFPQEAYQMLKWALADEIGLEYSTPKDVMDRIALKAERYKREFFASPAAQDQASVMFTPSGRRG